jgi:hypothetical protein
MMHEGDWSEKMKALSFNDGCIAMGVSGVS